MAIVDRFLEQAFVRLDAARAVGEVLMTPEQEREQRISFAFGNVALHNPAVTREMVERIVDEEAAKRTAK